MAFEQGYAWSERMSHAIIWGKIVLGKNEYEDLRRKSIWNLQRGQQNVMSKKKNDRKWEEEDSQS